MQACSAEPMEPPRWGSHLWIWALPQRSGWLWAAFGETLEESAGSTWRSWALEPRRAKAVPSRALLRQRYCAIRCLPIRCLPIAPGWKRAVSRRLALAAREALVKQPALALTSRQGQPPVSAWEPATRCRSRRLRSLPMACRARTNRRRPFSKRSPQGPALWLCSQGIAPFCR